MNRVSGFQHRKAGDRLVPPSWLHQLRRDFRRRDFSLVVRHEVLGNLRTP